MLAQRKRWNRDHQQKHSRFLQHIFSQHAIHHGLLATQKVFQ
jgi:hypothetical protein